MGADVAQRIVLVALHTSIQVHGVSRLGETSDMPVNMTSLGVDRGKRTNCRVLEVLIDHPVPLSDPLLEESDGLLTELLRTSICDSLRCMLETGQDTIHLLEDKGDRWSVILLLVWDGIQRLSNELHNLRVLSMIVTGLRRHTKNRRSSHVVMWQASNDKRNYWKSQSVCFSIFL